MFHMYFTKDQMIEYKSALKADKGFFLRFQQKLLEKGGFLSPSQYESNFISYAHGNEEMLRAIR